MKKILLLIGLFFVFTLTAIGSLAQEKKVNLYLFWTKTCPHCAKEKEYLSKLETKKPVKINLYEISQEPKNLKLLEAIGNQLKIDIGGVPITIIGNQSFIGFYNEEVTGKQFEQAIDQAISQGYPDPVSKIIESMSKDEDNQQAKLNAGQKSMPKQINLPFIGSIDLSQMSLWLITIIIAAVDGFNPCAMWILVFLISLLIGLKDRKRIWLLGSLFVFTSGFVYFLFLAAWLNLILFLGFISIIRIIIGLVALYAGYHNLKEYFTNKDNVCKVTQGQGRQKIFEKLKQITYEKSIWLAIVGIIVLAFAVNLVELICSAGLPAIFTQILALKKLSSIEYYLYLILYVFIFMLDDLIVFVVSIKTLQLTGATTKYSRMSHLIGGIIILILGLLLIFKPELLMGL